MSVHFLKELLEEIELYIIWNIGTTVLIWGEEVCHFTFDTVLLAMLI